MTMNAQHGGYVEGFMEVCIWIQCWLQSFSSVKARMAHTHLALARWPLSVWASEDDFKGMLLHPWCRCKYQSLLPRKPPWHVFGAYWYICKNPSMKNMRRMLRVCRAGLRMCFSESCGGWPFAFSCTRTQQLWYRLQLLICYGYVKGCYLKLETRQLCVGCGSDTAGHPDVVFSDSYLTLCGSIEHASPQCESRRSRSIQAHWVTC